MSSIVLDDATRAYVAGYLDGEGCFFAYGHHRYGIVCENTHRPTVEWLQELFGGNVTICKGRKSNHRTTYRWVVVGNEAAAVCKVIAPFLKEKWRSATIIIMFNHTTGLPLVGRNIHPEVKEARMKLVSMMKDQKRVSW